MIRRASSWLLRHGARSAANTVLRMGGRSVMDTALSAAVDAVPRSTPRTHTHVFNVKLPVTVYVRASHCRVTVRRTEAARVTVEANLVRAFGVEVKTDQDDAGVYIVARRKPVTGATARIDFVLTVPRGSELAFNLTPGELLFDEIDGKVELPATQIYAPMRSPEHPDRS